MLHSRIDLSRTSYTANLDFVVETSPDHEACLEIYTKYCRYKKFKSFMPIFESEFYDKSNDVITYWDRGNMVAFSLYRKYDSHNVEAIQFAWDYQNPKLRLGINSIKNECALYKERGYKYLYLGGAEDYKRSIDGFEVMVGFDD